jgi:hypothetical protein
MTAFFAGVCNLVLDLRFRFRQLPLLGASFSAHPRYYQRARSSGAHGGVESSHSSPPALVALSPGHFSGTGHELLRIKQCHCCALISSACGVLACSYQFGMWRFGMILVVSVLISSAFWHFGMIKCSHLFLSVCPPRAAPPPSPLG